jgi:hypothetical protein
MARSGKPQVGKEKYIAQRTTKDRYEPRQRTVGGVVSEGQIKIDQSTSYSDITRNYLDRFQGVPTITEFDLLQIDKKWRTIGKKAEAGILLGAKY